MPHYFLRASKALCLVVTGLALWGASQAALAADPLAAGLLRAIQADVAQQAGLSGKGVKVAVISAGAFGLQEAELAGALPTVTVVGGSSGQASSEGTAMLELVHQIAPNAALYYCDSQPMPLCVQTMVQQDGVNIVVDDIGQDYLPFAPSGFSFMYDQLLQSYPSLVLIHAAGNFYGDNNFNVWTPTTVSIGGTAYAVQDYGKASGGASQPYQTYTVQPGASYRGGVEWSDPANLPTPTSNDVMGVWILDSSNNVLASNQGNMPYGPVEATYINTTAQPVDIRLVAGIVKQNNTRPLGLLVWADSLLSMPSPGGAGGEYTTSAETLSIGAIDMPTVGTNTAGNIEPYSDQGPGLQYLSAMLDPRAPVAPNGVVNLVYSPLTTPITNQKPDLMGADCDDVYAAPDFKVVHGNFCGTSAAAPTVAGAMALLMEASHGTLSRAGLVSAFERTALHSVPGVGQGNWDGADGYGLIRTWDAAKPMLTLPVPTINTPANGAVAITSGSSVSFSGSCTESGGTISAYSWDFGDGTAPSTQASPGNHTFKATTTQTYTVSFTCTDANGITNPTPATVNVVVNVIPPKSGGGAMDLLCLALLGAGVARKKGLPKKRLNG